MDWVVEKRVESGMRSEDDDNEEQTCGAIKTGGG